MESERDSRRGSEVYNTMESTHTAQATDGVKLCDAQSRN
jgi:hypothetical protein